MAADNDITLHLTATQREHLQTEARRRHIEPVQLAEEFVRHALNRLADREVRRRKRGMEALSDLAALRARLPDSRGQVDVVEIIRQGRNDRSEDPIL